MVGAAVRIEVKRFLLDLFRRDYIPDVYGNEVGDKDIGVRARIHNFSRPSRASHERHSGD
jgi:hypothetical protein